MKSLRSISIVLMALACMLWSTPLAHAADPGVTPTEIKVGTSAGLTGPIAVWGNRMARIGPQTYFNYVNEQGGVHGLGGREVGHRNHQAADRRTHAGLPPRARSRSGRWVVDGSTDQPRRM